jgi:ketosteroid isomerase-like protein
VACREADRSQHEGDPRFHLDDPKDGRVYDNRYVIWGRMAWGKMREYEVYEDTEETRRLDQWLKGAEEV